MGSVMVKYGGAQMMAIYMSVMPAIHMSLTHERRVGILV